MFALAANAEVITLDLTTATNSAGKAIQYETQNKGGYPGLGTLQDVMDSTCSVDQTYSAIECNNKAFSFFHLPSGNSYGGTYWDGFTLSKVAADSLNQFACMAKGGLNGQGTPFVVGYYSPYCNNPEENKYSNLVMFGDKYTPVEVAICQSAYTHNYIVKGNDFTNKDTLTLIISAYDSDKGLTNKVNYYLAVDGKINKSWEKVDLSSLGACDGLVFSMTSTDVNEYGIATPTYFALDGLKVNYTPSALHNAAANTLNVYTHEGMLTVEGATAPVEIYTLQGYRMLSTTESHIDMTAWPHGIYLLKSGNNTLKVVK